jgi:PhzF family phenazine biosynthesis protein
MRVGFSLVDVFTDVPFAGNQLCVVPEPPNDLDGVTMQVLAREIGFSETTYVTAVREGGYDVRIFTPVSELPFAGHPTLGTAFVLARLGVVPPSVVQTSGAGDVPVEVELEAGVAAMKQLPPEFGGSFDDRDAVASAAGLDPNDLGAGQIMRVSTGIWHLMVPLRGRRHCDARLGTIEGVRASASERARNRCTCSRSVAPATSWLGCSTGPPRSGRTQRPDWPRGRSARTSPSSAGPGCPGT